MRHARGADDTTVQVGQRFANDDGHHHQSDEQHAVHAGADQERQDVVNVENVGDGTVQHRDAGLGPNGQLGRRPSHSGRTYHTQRSDYHIRWSIVVADHLRDKVCGHTDDGNQRYALEDPDGLESRAEGSII